MYVLKTYQRYLHEGTFDKAMDFYCPTWGDLLGARLFESEKQMKQWLKDRTNYQPWRLDMENPGWALVPFNEEAADLITALVKRMA